MVGFIQAPLFVPASRPTLFPKAVLSRPDAVILDLEDAVAEHHKEVARANIGCDFTSLPVIVRINGRGTKWHEADIAAVSNLRGVAVMLPKSEYPEEVAGVVSKLNGNPLIALIETARGVAQARAIAAQKGVVRLAFGSIDFCADMGCGNLREVLLPARSELVLASRLAGIMAPIDGVTMQLNDRALAYDDAAHARNLGMTGKLCIHPSQIAEVKRAFAPTESEIDWAHRVIATGDGAVSIDGIMVDEPARARARTVLATVERR